MNKKIFLTFGIGVLFFMGCSEKPMAYSVVELAGNTQVTGWGKNKKQHIQPLKTVNDSDGDGIPDNIDKCPDTLGNMPVDHNGCPIITTLKLNFDFNDATVKKIYYPQLEKVAQTLKNNPDLKIETAGHTDDLGSNEYNLKLSQKRAEAVKNILVNMFEIDPKRIKAKGYGKKYPLVPNTTETNRALNRRVEIINISN